MSLWLGCHLVLILASVIALGVSIFKTIGFKPSFYVASSNLLVSKTATWIECNYFELLMR